MCHFPFKKKLVSLARCPPERFCNIFIIPRIKQGNKSCYTLFNHPAYPHTHIYTYNNFWMHAITWRFINTELLCVCIPKWLILLRAIRVCICAHGPNCIHQFWFWFDFNFIASNGINFLIEAAVKTKTTGPIFSNPFWLKIHRELSAGNSLKPLHAHLIGG